MPHQLRRIIAINIRNSATGLPSGHISEIDPRGGVLAVGANGAGKTTLLRTIPLFYGATPQQILKGSGHPSLIWYTLPDQSSCIVFEYERESETDLRCVVMHARADQDAPQFHIIQGGYEERFFVNENNQFVTRDEFKARVEAMGLMVERKLFLHQYRSVILNEKLATKEGADLRRLAAKHAISPTPLYNLEQIAAAMANEKISFRDLTNIVIERVTDSGQDTGGGASVKELKQSRDAVVKWLRSREHIASVMALQPDATRLMGRVETIKGLHSRLCSLHVAAKQTISQIRTQREQLTQTRRQLADEYQKEEDRLKALAETLAQQKQTAEDEAGSLRAAVESADRRQAHFKSINIMKLEQDDVQEDALQSQLHHLNEQHTQLTSKAGDAQKRHDARKTAITQAANTQLGLLETRRTVIAEDLSKKLEDIRIAEQEAVTAFQRPGRLDEIAETRLELAGQLATAEERERNPLASEQARAQLTKATEEVQRLSGEVGTAQTGLNEATAAENSARALHDGNLSQVQSLQSDLSRARDQVSELRSRLNPEDGTLLAFLRKQEPGLWAPASRIIDPNLLARTDLDPTMDPDIDAGGKKVSIGGLALDVAALAEPDWVDAQALKVEISRQEQAVQSLEQLLSAAEAAAAKSSAALKSAEAKTASAKAQLNIAIEAHAASLQAYRTAAARVGDEQQAAKVSAKRDMENLKGQIASLEKEAKAIQESADKDLKRIRDDFKRQREEADQWKKDESNSIDQQKQAINGQLEADLNALATDLAKELSGLGIDPIKVSEMEKSIEKLQGRLRSIADNRHEVASWRDFSRSVLPGLEAKRVELEGHTAAITSIGDRLGEVGRKREELAEVIAKKSGEINDQIRQSESDEASLLELIERTLSKFRDHVNDVSIETQWNIAQIQQDTANAFSTLLSESDKARDEAKKLRSEMARQEGGPSDWLDLKERELPDPQTVLEHEFICAQARLVCSWFEPMEHGQYVNQLNKEMMAFMDAASSFIATLDRFDRSVDSFNRKLQAALSRIDGFERITDLDVQVKSAVSQIGYLKTLRGMQEVAATRSSTRASFSTLERELPSDENVSLIRSFREILQSDAGFRVNLGEMVRLECSVVENNKRKVITNEEEFKGVSSTGLTALIISMFLLGFVQMIRGDSPVRLVWIADEAAKFDDKNLGTYLQTLADNRIDLISAAPSLDINLARHYKRVCIFDTDGQVMEHKIDGEETHHVAA